MGHVAYLSLQTIPAYLRFLSNCTKSSCVLSTNSLSIGGCSVWELTPTYRSLFPLCTKLASLLLVVLVIVRSFLYKSVDIWTEWTSVALVLFTNESIISIIGCLHLLWLSPLKKKFHSFCILHRKIFFLSTSLPIFFFSSSSRKFFSPFPSFPPFPPSIFGSHCWGSKLLNDYPEQPRIET